MQRLTLDLIQKSTSLQELKEKPASNLKALRQFYIFNKDVSSYNEWMYNVKDSVFLSGKEDIWSQFIDSKFTIDVLKVLKCIICTYILFVCII